MAVLNPRERFSEVGEIFMLKEFIVSTAGRYQLVDITSGIGEAVAESGIKKGLAFIFVPHSTAGVLITENESGLKEDWFKVLKDLVSGYDFFHNWIDNNAGSHILSGILGQEKTIIIKDGKLLLGEWQQILLAEFDGPIKRKIIVKILEG